MQSVACLRDGASVAHTRGTSRQQVPWSGRATMYELDDLDEFDEIEIYVEKLQRILSGPPSLGSPPQPTCIASNVFLGSQANAENFEVLKKFKIGAVLNCAGYPQCLYNARAEAYRGTGIMYGELPMQDNETINITGMLRGASSLIEDAARRGIRVLIADSGVSRAGVIALAYLMHTGRYLLEATKDIKQERRTLLCNTSFMRQLVQYAHLMKKLDAQPYRFHAPRYGRVIDRPRIFSAHVPTERFSFS